MNVRTFATQRKMNVKQAKELIEQVLGLIPDSLSEEQIATLDQYLADCSRKVVAQISGETSSTSSSSNSQQTSNPSNHLPGERLETNLEANPEASQTSPNPEEPSPNNQITTTDPQQIDFVIETLGAEILRKNAALYEALSTQTAYRFVLEHRKFNQMLGEEVESEMRRDNHSLVHRLTDARVKVARETEAIVREHVLNTPKAVDLSKPPTVAVSKFQFNSEEERTSFINMLEELEIERLSEDLRS